MSFEQSMTRLEAIAARLEDEELDLDAALALFEEGIAELRAASHVSRERGSPAEATDRKRQRSIQGHRPACLTLPR